jgi:hypothetical protein
MPYARWARWAGWSAGGKGLSFPETPPPQPTSAVVNRLVTNANVAMALTRMWTREICPLMRFAGRTTYEPPWSRTCNGSPRLLRRPQHFQSRPGPYHTPRLSGYVPSTRWTLAGLTPNSLAALRMLSPLPTASRIPCSSAEAPRCSQHLPCRSRPGGQAGLDPFLDHRPLKLGEDTQHLEHRPTTGGRGVNCLAAQSSPRVATGSWRLQPRRSTAHAARMSNLPRRASLSM